MEEQEENKMTSDQVGLEDEEVTETESTKEVSETPVEGDDELALEEVTEDNEATDESVDESESEEPAVPEDQVDLEEKADQVGLEEEKAE